MVSGVRVDWKGVPAIGVNVMAAVAGESWQLGQTMEDINLAASWANRPISISDAEKVIEARGIVGELCLK